MTGLAENALLALGIWTWFVVAAVLMILELAAPGAFMVWLGLGAAATGVVSLIFVDMPWQQELLVFAVLALTSAVFGRDMMRRLNAGGTDRPFLNRRADAFVGREFVLAEPIVNGGGCVRVDDTIWRVTGADAPVGTRVRVARVDGAALVVEKV